MRHDTEVLVEDQGLAEVKTKVEERSEDILSPLSPSSSSLPKEVMYTSFTCVYGFSMYI